MDTPISRSPLLILAFKLYLGLYLIAPVPRPAHESEKTFRTILPNGELSEPRQLPCWINDRITKETLKPENALRRRSATLDDGDVFVSVVVPAYNEEERMGAMLDEAVSYLQQAYGNAHGSNTEERSEPRAVKTKTANCSNDGSTNGYNNGSANGNTVRNVSSRNRLVYGHANGTTSNKKSSRKGHVENYADIYNRIEKPGQGRGWEILVVSDGSTDRTVDFALDYAKRHQLSEYGDKSLGSKDRDSLQIPHGSIRVISLTQNRGKGGAVTHGMRHVRGQYAVFADADGASRFSDLAKLVERCHEIEDEHGRGVAIGSRAHLVGSTAVVQRSILRNFLMHSFHALLKLMTPKKTSQIKDTQCGFKLFSRASLPYIVPHMHSEGWIFDVEMLMLAEQAGIPMCEVPIGWTEVKGSKLNVIWDSLGMAWGLAVLRLAWGLGVYTTS